MEPTKATAAKGPCSFACQLKKLDTQAYETNRLGYYVAFWLIMAPLILWVAIKKRFDPKRRLQTNSVFFDGLSRRILGGIRKGAGTFSALDLIYNYYIHRATMQLEGAERIFSDFWLGMRNAQAVRNRKRVVVARLAELIAQSYRLRGGPVRIASIASGSAQAVMEAVKYAGVPARLLLIDHDEAALTHSRKLYHLLAMADMGVALETLERKAFICRDALREFNPHIVEMVGLLDYFDDDAAIKLMKRLATGMESGTYFIVANVVPNLERWFLRWVIDWEMVYRKGKHFCQVVAKSGFTNQEVLVEPLGLHTVLVCWKK